MAAEEELNKIYFRVEPTHKGNLFLGNSSSADILTKIGISKIKSYGYDCVEEPISPKGGAGEFWWETVKFLWEFRDVIGIIITTGQTIKHSVNRLVNKRHEQLKPTYMISLRVRKTTPSKEHEWYIEISDKLVGLKLLSQELYTFFSQEYPLFNFDQQIGVSISSKSFRVMVFLPHEKAGKISNYRLAKLLKIIKEKNNTQVIVDFGRFLLMRRNYSYVQADNSFWTGSIHSKTYYTFLPTKLYSRFPTKERSIYKKFELRVRGKLKIRRRVSNLLTKVVGERKSSRFKSVPEG